MGKETFQVTERLFELQDKEYGEFQKKLTPGIETKEVIGVRVPVVRSLAKEYKKDPESELFLQALPHQYYDENMLHGVLISELKDYEKVIELVDAFLPYVDNWAVCDIMSPKVFKKNTKRLLPHIEKWASSSHTYTCRFGVGMLMSFYLDDKFKPEYLEIPGRIRSEEYYVNMMLAWFFATALAKQWEATIPYLTESKLDVWVHNKTIQKARESYRISGEQKEYLKTLKRKSQ